MNKETIKKLKTGSEEAFEIVYEEYYRLIFHLVFQIVNDYRDTEDLTQEVFLKMYQKVADHDDTKNFKYWLIQIAKNHALDFVKKKNKEITSYNDNLVMEQKAPQSYSVTFKDILEFVTEEEFDIIILHLYHNMKFREIALIYETTTSSINNKYQRAIQKVQKGMKKI